MQRLYFLTLILIWLAKPAFSQQAVVDAIFSNALKSDVAYEQLRILCTTTEGRIAGSPQAAAAVEYTKQLMEQMDLDSVYLQKVMVPNWKRGEPEQARLISRVLGNQELSVTALGLSVGTGPQGLIAPVLEVQSLEELEQLGEAAVKGKIVFFNRAVNQDHYNTFQGYSGAVDQRVMGPLTAARLGAVAALVRSVTTASHDYPHTGVTRFDADGRNIPALAVSPKGADLLSQALKTDPDLSLYLRNTSHQLPDAVSYNVIGEIRGTDFPDQIITVGGHIDAWDNSQGAHDNGGGCVQSIDMLRIFRELNIQDEEIRQTGGNTYADSANAASEKHYFALESDRGVFTPRGFSIDAEGEQLEALQALKPYFEAYGMHEFVKGGSGVDIRPLKNYYNMAQAGLVTDSQRYFDLHHAASDTFEKINRRELNLGTAAMAAFIYLIDHLDTLGEE